MKVYKGGKPSNHKAGTEPNHLRLIGQRQQEEEIRTLDELDQAYAAMLLELIKPYHNPKSDRNEADLLLNLALIAWNLANMKKLASIAYEVMLQEAKEKFKENKEALKLFSKLVKEKEKKFDSFDSFIQNCEFTIAENGELHITTVDTISMEQFLRIGTMEEGELEGYDDVEDLFDDMLDEEYDFEPGYINRNAIIVTPRPAFMEWIKNRQGGTPALMITPEPSIYLIEEKESLKNVEGWIKKNVEKLFSKELEARYLNPELWPQNRTYKLFQEWFTVSCHSLVYDLEDTPVIKDVL